MLWLLSREVGSGGDCDIHGDDQIGTRAISGQSRWGEVCAFASSAFLQDGRIGEDTREAQEMALHRLWSRHGQDDRAKRCTPRELKDTSGLTGSSRLPGGTVAVDNERSIQCATISVCKRTAVGKSHRRVAHERKTTPGIFQSAGGLSGQLLT